MKIGVVSDTHGRIGIWRKVEAIFASADLIVHAGDILYHPPRLACPEDYDIPAMAAALNSSPTPIVLVHGNCDAEVYRELLDIPLQAPYALVRLDGTTILATHGYLFGREQMISLGKRFCAHIVISGHTHLPVLERADSIVLLNPGSPSFPKFEQDGRPVGTVALITDSDIRIVTIDDRRTIMELRR